MQEREVQLVRCTECGDLIPANALVCPFCYYYSADDGHYDHESSPHVMMLDLRSFVEEVSSMRRLTLAEGLWRYFTCREIDPFRLRIDTIDMNYYTIEEIVWLRFGHKPSVAQALYIFEEFMHQELEQRDAQVAKVRRVSKFIWFALLFVAVFTAAIFVNIWL